MYISGEATTFVVSGESVAVFFFFFVYKKSGNVHHDRTCKITLCQSIPSSSFSDRNPAHIQCCLTGTIMMHIASFCVKNCNSYPYDAH